MSHVSDLSIAERTKVAVELAPAFTHKFDFSEKKHYDDWAEVAFKAADALIALSTSKLAEAQALDDKEAAEALKAKLARENG